MKAILIGSGWRSNFYHRVAKELPNLLKISAVVTHTKERASDLKAHGLNAYSSLADALKEEHDYVIIATRSTFYSDMIESYERGERIIAETAFLPLNQYEREALRKIEGFTAEQYPYTPTYASLISASKQIGEIDQVMLSSLHNHHAISILRELITLDDIKAEEIEFLNFKSKVVKTGSRSGIELNNEEEEYERKIRLLRFNRALYIHDFSSNNYHNALLERKAEIRGSKGTLNMDYLLTTDEEGYVVKLPFTRHYDNLNKTSGSPVLSHISLGKDTIYKNPFYPALLNEDEIAIATIIRKIEKRDRVKTISEGIDDAILGAML